MGGKEIVSVYPRADVVGLANAVVDKQIIRGYAPIIARAEGLALHEKGHCRCGSCMRMTRDKANEAVLDMLGYDQHSHPSKQQFKVIKDYLYFLVPGQRGLEMKHGFEVDEARYDAWWEKVSKEKSDYNDPFGDVGKIS